MGDAATIAAAKIAADAQIASANAYADASRYGANVGAGASRYSSDSSAGASRYGADSSAQAQAAHDAMVSRDNALKLTQDAANADLASRTSTANTMLSYGYTPSEAKSFRLGPDITSRPTSSLDTRPRPTLASVGGRATYQTNFDQPQQLSQGTPRVPGHGDGTVDTVDAKLAPGEAVLNKAAAEMLGRGLIDLLNKHGMLQMGMVEPDADDGAAEPVQPPQHHAAGCSNVQHFAGGSPDVQPVSPYTPATPTGGMMDQARPNIKPSAPSVGYTPGSMGESIRAPREVNPYTPASPVGVPMLPQQRQNIQPSGAGVGYTPGSMGESIRAPREVNPYTPATPTGGMMDQARPNIKPSAPSVGYTPGSMGESIRAPITPVASVAPMPSGGREALFRAEGISQPQAPVAAPAGAQGRSVSQYEADMAARAARPAPQPAMDFEAAAKTLQAQPFNLMSAGAAPRTQMPQAPGPFSPTAPAASPMDFNAAAASLRGGPFTLPPAVEQMEPGRGQPRTQMPQAPAPLGNPKTPGLTFDQAFAAARREFGGKGGDFEWTNPETGKTGHYQTNTRKEGLQRRGLKPVGQMV